jgi:uroporphyrin-III C-methyltransferase
MTDTIPEEKPVAPKRFPWAKLGLIISFLALFILVAGFAYGYYQWLRIHQQLSALTTAIIQNDHSDQVTTLQQSVADMQQAMQKTQAGDVNQWHLAQAEYLTRMANDQLQYTHNHKMALQLLQQADEILQSSQDANVMNIRKSLDTDIVNLQSASEVDVTSIYTRINALHESIDKLPLPSQPLSQTTTTTPDKSTTLWQSILNGLNKIVIVRKMDSSALPLVLPDEKIFLYQNLHAQLQNATWGLLHDNPAIYTASLEQAIAWIKQYFVADAPETQNVLQQLTELKQVNLQPANITLTNTLQLFESNHPQAKSAEGTT